MIISITGPSGVGKTTLLRNLLQALPKAQPLTSTTTRAPRPSDVDGEYHYVSFDEFERLSQSGVFLWEAKTTSNRYGTRKSDVDAALAGGTYLPILVIDAAQKLNAYAQSMQQLGAVRFMYIEITDEEELHKRLRERGEAPEEIEARIAACRSWNKDARASSVPFIFLNATKSREEILKKALAHIQNVH